MRVGIISFPGSNCDRDLHTVLKDDVSVRQVDYLWHANSFSENYDIVFLPGGFSYGDYLRAGKLACFSLAMQSLYVHINNGRFVVGICNGFQILCEAKILPGVLMHNHRQRHICREVAVHFTQKNPFATILPPQITYKLPISHSEGNYYAPSEVIQELFANNQVFCLYEDNPNGSLENIAGISSKNQRVLGMMPHPERAVFTTNNNHQSLGKTVIQSILAACQ